MDDNNATTTEEKPPVKLVPKCTAKALLGNVVVGDDVLKGLGNNTRWVVDIDAISGQDVKIKCVDYFGGREIKPDVMSFTIAPLSHTAWDAKPIGVQDGASLTVKSLVVHSGPGNTAPQRYQCRVSIDIIHRSR